MIMAITTKEWSRVITWFNGWKLILEEVKGKYCLKSVDKQLHHWVEDVGASP